VAARKDYVAGMQVWNFADFAAVQGIMRVGGLKSIPGILEAAKGAKVLIVSSLAEDGAEETVAAKKEALKQCPDGGTYPS